MTTVQIDKMRLDVMRRVMDCSSDTLAKIQDYLESASESKLIDWSTMPGQFSHEEKMARLDRAEKDFEDGKGISEEEMIAYIDSL